MKKILFLFLLSVWGIQAQSDFEILGNLPQQLNESSGLLLAGDLLISHNDSGNEPLLYELDTVSLQIVRQVQVANAVNTDWEDLAQDEEFLYIADIGNNSGTRTDLKILKVSKTDFKSGNTVNAEVISYAYEDQTDFSGNGNSDWDAEALIAQGDSLYIFTKQWQSLGTVVYSLPKTAGNFQARRIAEFPLNGLVTGADITAATENIIVLGYSTQLQPFIFTISSIGSSDFPGGFEKYTLPIGFAQAEGVAVGNNNMLYVSSEDFSNSLLSLPAAVFKLKLAPTDNQTDGGGEPEPDPEDGAQDSDRLLLVSSPRSDILQYRLPSETTVLAHAVFDSSGRQLLLQKGSEIREGEVDISALSPAVYYLKLFLGSGSRARAFLRY
ncbi:T9SS type A sorting domain-containing protein [Robiginitalea sp. IMCC44478]|uniref:T9SS type A sorting domain-containing protein n=1 Tax=Robiginitalea sp. IMCC44478 TaxID=3459122 RepID=UPI0040426941